MELLISLPFSLTSSDRLFIWIIDYIPDYKYRNLCRTCQYLIQFYSWADEYVHNTEAFIFCSDNDPKFILCLEYSVSVMSYTTTFIDADA